MGRVRGIGTARKWFRKHRIGYLLILPSCLFVLGFIIIPLFEGISLSLTTEEFGGRGAVFAGAANYVSLFRSDAAFWQAMLRTLVWAIATVAIVYCTGLALSTLLNQDIRGRAIFRSLLLIPWVIPNIVVASIWRWMYHDQFGFINSALTGLGLISQPIQWLSDPTLAFISVIMVFVWKYTPFMTITLLAGMQSISHDYYEAAQIDGASSFQSFLYVTLPLLKPVSITSTLLLSIWAFNHFDILYVLTGGGPSKATTLLSIEIYNRAFFSLDIGYAAAMGCVMLLGLLGFAVLYLKSYAQTAA
ncbi:MAG TPA: sugar ABC transporter permease [Firmicutes bacterium]|nr:sugar ABC transporter permease [Bacillota bacterium]